MRTLRTITVALLIVVLTMPAVVAQLDIPPEYAPREQAQREDAPREDAQQDDTPQFRPFTFAVFGDSQPFNAAYSPVLAEIARQIGQLPVPFVIGVGDYINGSSNQSTVRRQWQGFFTALAPLQVNREIPVALAPGNHDIGGIRRNAEIFCEYFGKLYFSFDYEGCHFIILDTETIGADARITGTQLEWLKQDLANAADARFTFVAMHRPLFPVGPNAGFSLDRHPKERDALHKLFVDSGVDAVFQGHEHLYNYRERDGVHYFITGGAGAQLYAEPEHGGFHHFLLVSVEDDGFTVEVQRITP